jgi:hypothetical protein
MAFTSIWSFTLVPQVQVMKPITKKLSTRAISPDGIIITLEDMKDWDKDKKNSVSETR